MTELEAKKLLLSCPGDSIQEIIDELKMSQAELAERLGRSIPKLNELIKGKAPITKETATKLEYVLNVPANFWINLERQYQDELLEIEQMEFLEQCKEWVSGFPLARLKKLGILPNSTKKPVLVKSLLKFFRVASPKQWSDIYKENSLAFKIELRHTTEPEAISVWLRIGELQAEKLTLVSFERKSMQAKIRERLNEIQLLSYNKPNNWLDILQKICIDCGIALVYTPCIAKAPIYGATRWIKNKTLPLIQITDRGKDYHSFWFTFYHELAHILLHGKNEIFIDGLDSITPDINKEKQADAFAAKKLLSDKERTELSKVSHFNKTIIISLSEKIKKHPSIIVGQIQRQNPTLYKNIALNKLKEKVVFKELTI